MGASKITLEIVGVFNPSPLSGGTLRNSLSQLFCLLSLLGNLQSTISLFGSKLAAHGDGGTCSDSEAGGVPHGGDDIVGPLLLHLDISDGRGVTPSSGSGGGDVLSDGEIVVAPDAAVVVRLPLILLGEHGCQDGASAPASFFLNNRNLAGLIISVGGRGCLLLLLWLFRFGREGVMGFNF